MIDLQMAGLKTPARFGKSDAWAEGCVSKTHSEAEAFCIAQGGRLPSVVEIIIGCAQGPECGYDSALIWSGTPDSTTASTTVTENINSYHALIMNNASNLCMIFLAFIGFSAIVYAFVNHFKQKQEYVNVELANDI